MNAPAERSRRDRFRRLARAASSAAARGLAYGAASALGSTAVHALTWWITTH